MTAPATQPKGATPRLPAGWCTRSRPCAPRHPDPCIRSTCRWWWAAACAPATRVAQAPDQEAPAVTSWILAIDFGTSYTVAAARVGDRPPEIVDLAGERRMPSVVMVDP